MNLNLNDSDFVVCDGERWKVGVPPCSKTIHLTHTHGMSYLQTTQGEIILAVINGYVTIETPVPDGRVMVISSRPTQPSEHGGHAPLTKLRTALGQ